MSQPLPEPATPLTKWKHALIVAALAAAGPFLASLVTSGVVTQAIASPIAVLVGEALIYEHSE